MRWANLGSRLYRNPMLLGMRNEPYSLQSRGPVRGVLASTLVLAYMCIRW